ncbi:ATP synthase F(0) complex subunit B1, mitochondrial-like [Asterias rubens]|uniref:ATP synthase F(0) complex subunit B1, mitochondrial-like n=1 Tax=Asterias rubens TaxID=7604 RepID=UPI001455056A|nr:ATP synthase F(0) complex subunit B1, mitochondrial-like [Asterias rubens]
MISRLALRNGSILSAAFLRTSTPCVTAAPKLLFHTSEQQFMPKKLPEVGGQVRFGFIPEEWFQFFYNKTGVTGPYMFGTGLIMYLLNKEIYVVGPETVHAFVALSVLVYGIKKFGPTVASSCDKNIQEMLDKANVGKNESMGILANAIEEEKKEQWRLDGRNYLFEARKENVDMQLEIEYRERLKMVNDEIKKRLDYQVELDNMNKRMEQVHMVRWIEQNVIKSITPQQEKDILGKCITNLKSMSTA